MVAVGIVAVGIVAVGFVAVGIAAVGIVAVGIFPVGCVGALKVGTVAVGTDNVGGPPLMLLVEGETTLFGDFTGVCIGMHTDGTVAVVGDRVVDDDSLAPDFNDEIGYSDFLNSEDISAEVGWKFSRWFRFPIVHNNITVMQMNDRILLNMFIFHCP